MHFSPRLLYLLNYFSELPLDCQTARENTKSNQLAVSAQR
uniref:Uncharacterized protein n=1 Tax=Anguilla anguilla TaxID=7936 RepID=A0A0E9Q1Q2_ANGAN